MFLSKLQIMLLAWSICVIYLATLHLNYALCNILWAYTRCWLCSWAIFCTIWVAFAIWHRIALKVICKHCRHWAQLPYFRIPFLESWTNIFGTEAIFFLAGCCWQEVLFTPQSASSSRKSATCSRSTSCGQFVITDQLEKDLFDRYNNSNKRNCREDDTVYHWQHQPFREA